MIQKNAVSSKQLGLLTRSRNGCKACKIRHVKCDERKPVCMRCAARGAICEGGNNNLSAPANVQNIPDFLISGMSSSFRSQIEDRSFSYFRENAVVGLMGFDHGSDFWSSMVMQLCEAAPAVLHATIALSSLYEQVYHRRLPPNLSKHNVISLQQYNKSIKGLRLSNQPVQITLTCCILFICLENLSGNHETALEHLKNGLKILEGWRTKGTSTASEEQALRNITDVFRRFDMQATAFLDSRQPQLNATSISANLQEPSSDPTSFSSLGEGQIALERIAVRLLYVLTIKSSPDTRSYSQENAFLPVRQTLLRGLITRLAQWKESFDDLTTRRNGTMHTKDLQLAVLLALHHETSSLMLEANLHPQTAPDDSKFTRINELSRSLIDATAKSTFSADMGIIAPLYFSAMNSTNTTIQQQAIQLLRLINWKEGFWNADVAAEIAGKALKLQTQNTQARISGGIPELSKLLSVLDIS